MRTRRLISMTVALGTLLSALGPVGAAAQRSSASVLSEHEIERLDSMPPQGQAELLLERAVNRFQGATEQIGARLSGWRGRITSTPRLEYLFQTAINSDDMAVRAAGIEVNLVARNLEKSSATVDRLEPVARSGEQSARVNALWNLGLLGNRGVQPERAFDILMGSLHDSNENVRYWAVEGLAYLGTSETIAPLLSVFHDRQTRSWVFQALRDITGQSLPPNAGTWRHWYNFSGQK
jgi:HEAT repeat protein